MAPRKRPRTPGTQAPRPRGAPLTPTDISKAAGLKAFREKVGKTQVELAAELGISQSTLAGYEGGKYAVPDDIFETLLELAKAHADGEGGNPGGAPTGEGNDPPPGPGGSVPPAGDRPPSVTDQMHAGISAALSKELTANQKKIAADLAAMYQLLGTLVANVHTDAGSIIYGDATVLAQSAVAAAEESPLIKRFVELMSQGPVFQFAVLHALTAMKVETVIRESRRERRAVDDLRRATDAAKVVDIGAPPAPPGADEMVDPLEQYRRAVA